MFNIVQHRHTYFILSALIISLGIAAMIYSLITTGDIFPLGVDFRSGTRFELQFTEPVSEIEVRNVFTGFGINNPAIIALRGENLQDFQLQAKARSDLN